MSCTCLPPIRLNAGHTPGSEGRWYGTRVSTVIMIKDTGETTFVERDIGMLDGTGGIKKGGGERRYMFAARRAS